MTPEEKAEVERASTLFHVALVQLGAKSIEDALSLWDDVPPIPTTGATRATQAWLDTTVRYVMQRRLRARDLALAYYRYQRALTTGTTIAIPGQENPPYLTLFELKREFEAYLTTPSERAAEQPATNETQEVSEAASEPVSTPEDDEIARLEAEEEAEREREDQILVETIEGLDEAMAEEERRAEEEIEKALQALGPDNMNQKMRVIEVESADELDKARDQAHNEAGNRQAATVARESMNGARGTLFGVGANDKRVLGFARVSRTGTPCGWCAMLISKGFVTRNGKPSGGLFRSAQGSSANVTFGDLDLYHDNCQCYAVPIFNLEQMQSPLFALNRKYAEQWPRVTKGLGGKSAVSAWRRFIRQEAKSQKSQVAAA